MTNKKAPPSTPLRRILAIVAISANILLALLTIASAYGGIVNPAHTAIPALLAMIFPIFLILTIILTIVNAIWWRRRALIGLATIILCTGPILTFCPLNIFRPSRATVAAYGPRALKIMTFNVFQFRDVSTLPSAIPGNPSVRFIVHNDPDIVLCQEASALFDPPGPLSRADIDLLASRYPHSYASRRGMVILSKYPFRRIEVPVSDENTFDICRYDITVNGTPIHIFNLHLQSIGLTSNDKALYRDITRGDAPGGGINQLRHGILHKLGVAFRARARQALEIRKILDGVTGNIILAGDFNDIPDSYASRIIQASDLADAYLHAGLGPAITYHADRLYFRIDQMFYRGDIEPLRVDVLKCPASDHYPLMASFLLPPEQS